VVAFWRWSCRRCLPLGIFGVFEDTFLDGLQYSMPGPLWPHGRPVLVSFHFSFVQRLRLVPALVFRTWPDFFLHFAIACDARADGHVDPAYACLTL